MNLDNYLNTLTESELDEYEQQVMFEDYIAEKMYEEYLEEERNSYYFRQIGIGCNSQVRKADPSIPF